MATATLTSKGQTTIPKDVRERLGLEAGDLLHFTVLPDGAVIMRAKKRGTDAIAGMLYAPGRTALSVEAMDAAIAAAAGARARMHRSARRAPKSR